MDPFIQDLEKTNTNLSMNIDKVEVREDKHVERSCSWKSKY